MTRNRRTRKSRPIGVVRAVSISSFAILLAAVLFLQAGSSVLARKNPVVAIQLNPLNGLALEQLASRKFTTGVKTEADIVPAAVTARVAALHSFRRDALVPKAHAILAVAQVDPAKREAIYVAAVRANRRDILLQSFVLKEKLAARDYAGTLDTLDTILRAHPQQQETLFPVLASALATDETLSAFAGIFARDSADWRESFLKFAASNEAALPNLATLRLARTGPVDPLTDDQIIRGLTALGRVDQAHQVYRAATGQAGQSSATNGSLDWTDRFVPFDWYFSDEGNFRAQPTLSGDRLEILARSGAGGIIATRTIAAPAGRFTLRSDSDLPPQDRDGGARLQLVCYGEEAPFFDEPFGKGRTSYSSAGPPGNCAFLTIKIYVRAWSGSSAIRGTLSRLTILPQG